MSSIYPKLKVELDLASGLTEFIVQPDNRDMVRYDLARPRNGWPSFQDAPMFSLNYMAWHALKRSDSYTADFEAFLDVCSNLEPIDETENTVNPTEALGALVMPDPSSGTVTPTT